MILEVLLILLLVNLASFLLRKVGIPKVLTLLIVGVLCGLPLIKNLLFVESLELLPQLARVGLVMLMFTAGLEISWSELLKERKDALFLAFFGISIPFVLGFLLMLALGYDLLVAISVGLAMSITAEATTAEVLIETGKIKTKLGALMMGGGILDDLIGITLFFGFSYFFLHTGGESLVEFWNLILVLGAFFAGVLVHFLFDREKKIIGQFEKAVGLLLVPFFFVEMGMHFEIASIADSWWLILLITLVAMIGKMSGVLLSRISIKLSLLQAYLIGWGMNSRGAVGLALAFSGLKLGILDGEIYSALIVMIFVSTLIFPIAFTRILKKHKHIMD